MASASGELFVHQWNYVSAVLRRFPHRSTKVTTPISPYAIEGNNMHESLDMASVKHYQLMLGLLMHLAMVTRPDIAFAVGFAARRAAAPTARDTKLVERILAFVANTADLGLTFRKTGEPRLGIKAYVDASYADDVQTNRSTSGFVFVAAGAAVSWASRRQPWVALSTAESEINAAVECVREAKWLTNMVNAFIARTKGEPLKFGLEIAEDNSAALAIVDRGGVKRNVRHVLVRIAYLKEAKEDKFVLKPIKSVDNVADAFTKALDGQRLRLLATGMGLTQAPKSHP